MGKCDASVGHAARLRASCWPPNRRWG